MRYNLSRREGTVPSRQFIRSANIYDGCVIGSGVPLVVPQQKY